MKDKALTFLYVDGTHNIIIRVFVCMKKINVPF